MVFEGIGVTMLAEKKLVCLCESSCCCVKIVAFISHLLVFHLPMQLLVYKDKKQLFS